MLPPPPLFPHLKVCGVQTRPLKHSPLPWLGVTPVQRQRGSGTPGGHPSHLRCWSDSGTAPSDTAGCGHSAARCHPCIPGTWLLHPPQRPATGGVRWGQQMQDSYDLQCMAVTQWKNWERADPYLLSQAIQQCCPQLALLHLPFSNLETWKDIMQQTMHHMGVM